MVLTVLETVVERLRAAERTEQRPEETAEVMTSRNELEAVVKDGVVAGLEEYERRTGGAQTEEDADESSRSLTKLLAGAALLLYLAFARGKLMGGKTREPSDEREVPIGSSSSTGQPSELPGLLV
jgi:hypothetical protein